MQSTRKRKVAEGGKYIKIIKDDKSTSLIMNLQDQTKLLEAQFASEKTRNEHITAQMDTLKNNAMHAENENSKMKSKHNKLIRESCESKDSSERKHAKDRNEIDNLKKQLDAALTGKQILENEVKKQQIINANLKNQPRPSNGAREAEKQLNKISFSSSLESKKDINTKDKLCTELNSSQVENEVNALEISMHDLLNSTKEYSTLSNLATDHMNLQNELENNCNSSITLEKNDLEKRINALTNQSYALQSFVRATLEFISSRDIRDGIIAKNDDLSQISTIDSLHDSNEFEAPSNFAPQEDGGRLELDKDERIKFLGLQSDTFQVFLESSTENGKTEHDLQILILETVKFR